MVKVDALEGMRVLDVACGVWHTAAVAADRIGSAGSALEGLGLLEAHAIQEKMADAYNALDDVCTPSCYP